MEYDRGVLKLQDVLRVQVAAARDGGGGGGGGGNAILVLFIFLLISRLKFLLHPLSMVCPSAPRITYVHLIC